MADSSQDRANDETPYRVSLSGPGPLLSAERPDVARFIPGTVVARRYRIVGLVGRGGMGEVYRADDLKLGQPVALKFLPQGLSRDVGLLVRLFNEVRMARQVTHSSVCRVYDIYEEGGQHFISMEYVDGEDLASLLRRIGRLPKDKAIQIAREICAGLTAAHEQGILHRDLKPANIMIDGRGRVRITDFGLAGLAAGLREAEIFAGTPSYMAPEQLAGRAVTIQSDLYALGLVLYKIFTGRSPFAADTIPALRELQETTSPVSPSHLIEGFDPQVERVIMRCLAREPADRPSSAIAVATALPGASPLEAILAAGKTPAPDLVADAGGSGVLPPRLAWTCLVGFGAGVALVFALSARTQLYRLVPLEYPPEVLAKTARDVVHAMGYADAPVDSVYGFAHDGDHLRFIAARAPSSNWRTKLASDGPSPILFWYRQSPSYLLPKERRAIGPTDPDPPHIVPAMARVHLDPSGRLRSFSVVPPRFSDSAPSPDTDWSLLFERAGLDPSRFVPATPGWTPDVSTDSRAAWEGVYPGQERWPARVEAGAFRGRPVYFEVLMPWDQIPAEAGTPPTFLTSASGLLQAGVFIVALIGAAVVARRNTLLGRGHRRGAIRLAVCILALHLLQWVLAGHHVPDQAEVYSFSADLAWSVYFCVLGWLFYLALEPDFRRLWPGAIVSWVRLLEGRFWDPLVGRDVLIGGLYGLSATLLIQFYQIAPALLGLPSPRPDLLGTPGVEAASLMGTRHALALLFSAQETALFEGLLFAVVVVLVRSLFRSHALAVTGLLILGAFFIARSAGDPLLDLVYGGAQAVLWLFVLLRFGLLSMVIGVFFQAVLYGHPLTFNLSTWYAGTSFLALGVATVLGWYGMYTSLARRSARTLPRP